MELGIGKERFKKAMRLLRRRVRGWVRRPRVTGVVPPMFPGGGRVAVEEEEAAVAAVRDVLRSRKLFRFYGAKPRLLERSRVTDLEKRFSSYVGTQHALAVNSGTSALVCALKALGVGPGHEVIVPAYTWFATPAAVLAVGAVPVIAEVDASLGLDPKDVHRKLTPQTKALLPVHMRGDPAAMDTLLALAREKGLVVLEDAAQAAGARVGGRPVGRLADMGAFSFQMSKIITAGEGGMVTTDDDALFRRAAMYHDNAVVPHMGFSLDEWLPGLNSRMSELHAAVLSVQLERLEGIVGTTRAHHAQLEGTVQDAFESKGIRLRVKNDSEGGTGIAFIFFLPEAKQARRVVSTLFDDGVPASSLYRDVPNDIVDLHAAPNWAPLIERRTWTSGDGPWKGHARDVSYDPEMWPATMDLLRRAVHVDVSPDLKREQAEQIGTAIVAAVERYV